MKNLITDFTVFVNEKYSFGSLEEKGPGDKKSSSNLKNKLSIIGSTKSPTKNIDALKAIKDHYKTFSSPIDLTGEPSNNNAYFRRAKSAKHEIAPKTEKGKNDYIKLGDKVLLTGDKTKDPITYKIAYRELMLNKELDLEASGNGIYIIGRVLTALVDKKIGLDQNLELYMNLKKPININMDLDTGTQGVQDINRSILALMVVSEAIVPLEQNKQFPVFVAKENRGEGAQAKLYKVFLNNGAMPTLSVFTAGPETQEKLKNTSHKAALDATEKIKPYAKKRLTKSDIKEAQEIYANLYRAFQKPYYEAKGERLKKAIEMECESAGIKIDSFKTIFENIDKSIKQSTSDETAKKQIDKQIYDFGKDNDEDNLYALFHYQFIYDINGPSGDPGLQSKVTKFKGTEGAFR